MICDKFDCDLIEDVDHDFFHKQVFDFSRFEDGTDRSYVDIYVIDPQSYWLDIYEYIFEGPRYDLDEREKLKDELREKEETGIMETEKFYVDKIKESMKGYYRIFRKVFPTQIAVGSITLIDGVVIITKNGETNAYKCPF